MPENELGPVGDVVADPVEFLQAAVMRVEGRLPWSSNATFLVRLVDDGRQHLAVYKPVAGERPLWDFPPGLDRRERAAFVLSEHVGLGAVPPTVLRDGEFGPGSVQWFVDANHAEHYFSLLEHYPELAGQFRRLAAFDVLINNTDRKAGHVLLADATVWAIDNGLCFAAEEKLRTVIWEFAGDPLDDDLAAEIAALTRDVPDELSALLSPTEIEALQDRAEQLTTAGVLPSDPTGHRYPWPLI